MACMHAIAPEIITESIPPQKVVGEFSWLFWGSPRASHIKASHPHFPRFPRFRVRIFRFFRVFRFFGLWSLLRPLFCRVRGAFRIFRIFAVSGSNRWFRKSDRPALLWPALGDRDFLQAILGVQFSGHLRIIFGAHQTNLDGDNSPCVLQGVATAWKKGSGEPQNWSEIAPASVPLPEALYEQPVLQSHDFSRHQIGPFKNTILKDILRPQKMPWLKHDYHPNGNGCYFNYLHFISASASAM